MTNAWDSFENKSWEKENELINHRLTWLGSTQSFLFIGSIVALRLEFDIVEYVSLFGAATSFLIFVGTLAACRAQHSIARSHRPLRSKLNRCTTWMGWSTAVLLPLAFVLGWIWLHGESKRGTIPAVVEEQTIQFDAPIRFVIGDTEVLKIERISSSTDKKSDESEELD